ncbi:hypothetical protein MRX96_008554 [Rhipicephalus microplus]
MLESMTTESLNLKDARFFLSMTLGARSQNQKYHHLYPAPPETDVDEYKSVRVEKGDFRATNTELTCVLWTGGGDPRLILAPLKVEVLSQTPRVVLFADFFTLAELAYMQDSGRTGLQRGSIYDWEHPSGITSYKRISKVSWLWDTKHPFRNSLGRRISLASGLSFESSEPYQVANYGLGGHYTPREEANTFDQIADEWDTGSGDRVATMLLYQQTSRRWCHSIHPSETGRETSACLGTLLRKTLEVLTNHVGCLVFWGTKWIAIKRIRERNNVVVRFEYPG